jgi:6-phosphogluconolactonase
LGHGLVTATTSGGATIVVVPDPTAGAAEAAEHIARSLVAAADARGRADWVTTGGSTVPGIYGRLAAEPLVDEMPWEHVHIWWGDDRMVPRDHPWSNVKPLDDILLGIGWGEEGTAGGPAGVPLPIENLHPFRAGEAIAHGRDAASCAADLSGELKAAALDEQDGWPVLDLIVVGMGPDGHILSVFPGSPAFASDALALAIPAPTHIEPHVERVTLNPALLRVAREVLVVAFGAAKAATVAEVFGPERDPARWPAQLATRPGSTWILDEAAASALPR